MSGEEIGEFEEEQVQEDTGDKLPVSPEAVPTPSPGDDLSEALARLARIEAELLVLASAERDKERGPRRGVKIAQFIETNWMVRLVVFGLSAVVLGIGAWGVMIYAEERQARVEERLARAWQNLATSAVGNSGKGAAINHLSNAGIELDHLQVHLFLRCSSCAQSLENPLATDASLVEIQR